MTNYTAPIGTVSNAPNYTAIAATARDMARTASAHYADQLLHIAKDAEAALDGCEASARSVAAFIDGEHELEMAADSAAFALERAA